MQLTFTVKLVSHVDIARRTRYKHSLDDCQESSQDVADGNDEISFRYTLSSTCLYSMLLLLLLVQWKCVSHITAGPISSRLYFLRLKNINFISCCLLHGEKYDNYLFLFCHESNHLYDDDAE